MFERNTPSGLPIQLAIAAALLAASLFEIPNRSAPKPANGQPGDAARTAAEVAVQPSPEPFPITRPGIELIWNHLR